MLTGAFIWLLGTTIIWLWTSNEGNNPWLWAFLSLIFSPLTSGVIYLVCTRFIGVVDYK